MNVEADFTTIQIPLSIWMRYHYIGHKYLHVVLMQKKYNITYPSLISLISFDIIDLW